MVSGNKVDLATYVKALGDELKGVAKANADKGGEGESKEGGEEEKKEEEGGGTNPFESFDPYSKKWSLKSLVELSKDEFKAQQDALKAEMEAGKAKIKAAKDKMSDLKKQPIEDGVINEIGFGDQDLQAIHFETDPEKQKKLKLAYGAKLGGITSREKIEDADYELKRFRKQIKFGDGTNLGPFVPGSYEAINSELGDGPHARKQRKPQSWNRRSYNKWIEDMASGGGADHAYDMAQNAKLEPGLLQWVKRNLVNGETPLERIQYDIEALAESSFSTKPIVESVISDILVIAFESTTYEKFISELISQKLLKRSDLKDPELVDELKTMYRGQALGKRESVNETHISEPYIFQVGDVIRNTNPQCKHFGSMGIVQSVMDMDDNIGQLIKYLVTNYGDTFKPGMSLTKTPDQLEPMDDYDNDWDDWENHHEPHHHSDDDDYEEYEIEYDDDYED
jgi:hypothetical protein